MARRGMRRQRRPVRSGQAWPFSQESVLAAGWAQDHARGAWEHAAWLADGLPVRRGSVDADLQFLAFLARHVVGCPACRREGAGGTPEDWLWRAVRSQRRLRALAEPLQRGAGGSG